MAKKSRMGSDPLVRSLEKNILNLEDQAENTGGVDALIKDTRDTSKSEKEAKPSTKAKAKAEPTKTVKKAKTASKESIESKKPAKSKEIKKAAPEAKKPVDTVSEIKKPVVKETSPEMEFEPGAVIDLDAPLEGQAAPAKAAINKTEAPEAATTAREPEAEVAKIQKQPVKVKEDVKDDYTEKAKVSEPGQLLKGYEDQDDADQFLGFSLGQEYFAFEIGSVREVLTYTSVTGVPQTPEFMSGVINLRGNVVPVVDLRLLFGLEKGEETVDTCIIIVEVEFEDEVIEIGATADAVREVFNLKEEDIEPAPKIGKHLNTDFIKGMGRKDGEFTLILDLKEVFSAKILFGG
jgi:purine-binding chemotaxis protein CheW